MGEKWVRGRGYYNSKTHKKMKTRKQFDAYAFSENECEEIKGRRYDTYVRSWRSHHDKSFKENEPEV